MGFSEKLQRFRKDAGLTQQQLAERTEFSQNAISQWETGEREPSWSAVQALAKALGVDCNAFRDESPAADPPVPPRPKGKGKAKGS